LEVNITAIAGLFLALGLLAFLFIVGGSAAPGTSLTGYGDAILVALILMATLAVVAWSYGRASSSGRY
jgi:hypothetical protein